MEYIESILWVVGSVAFFLTFAGLQRMFFPHTIANGFMDLDKLKEICPELFKKNNNPL
jgi:hypothetical protein